MSLPLQIDFLHMETSDALTEVIREKCEKLLKMSDRVTQCHVTVESPHRNHVKGNLFQVGIQLSLPGKTLSVTQNGAAATEHEDAYKAVRDAFSSMQRQLKAYTDKSKGHVKNHNRETVLEKIAVSDEEPM